MKKNSLIVILLIISFFLGWWIRNPHQNLDIGTSLSPKQKDKPFEKYTIENLSKADIKEGKLQMSMKLSETDDYTSYLMHFLFNPDLDGKEIKSSTGQINLPSQAGIPNQGGKFPIIVMVRGYIDQENFKTGDGTRNAAAFFAKNGFLTLAPDFLGYGESDGETGNIFEARFQSYVLVLSLLKSVNQIREWDGKNIFIWGHSNGGQIAITTLEVTGGKYPTTLWAPVSKLFPYSVLYYTDATSDRGKLIRSELAKFEKDYDPDLYSLDLYLDKIQAPILLHQGTADDAVPKAWSDSLVSKLKSFDKDVTYYVYPGTDHNMKPSWDTVVSRDLEFFKSRVNN